MSLMILYMQYCAFGLISSGYVTEGNAERKCLIFLTNKVKNICQFLRIISLSGYCMFPGDVLI